MKQIQTIAVGKIYKIYNTINNKVYIGQTTTTLKQRFSKHIQSIKSNDRKKMKLYNAMLKYGTSNFYIELIEDNVPTKDLIDREEYWIRYYDSVNNGYNLKYRTECPAYNTLVFVSKEQLENMYKTMSSVDIAKELKVSHQTVLKWLKSYNIQTRASGINYITYTFDKILTKELLHQLFIVENRTIAYIAKKTSTTQPAVKLRLKKFGIRKTPGQHRSKFKDLEEQMIILRNQGLSFAKIAKELNCCEEALRHYYKTNMS